MTICHTTGPKMSQCSLHKSARIEQKSQKCFSRDGFHQLLPSQFCRKNKSVSLLGGAEKTFKDSCSDDLRPLKFNHFKLQCPLKRVPFYFG